jgi:pyrroline-5-carboxylate reductase
MQKFNLQQIMNTKSIGFIGAGRITKIFLQAYKNKKVNFDKIVVVDTNTETTNNLKQQFPTIEISGIEQVSSQDIVVIALHPPVIMETLEKVLPYVTEKTWVLSLAPKVKIAGIANKLNTVTKIVRMIPNATSVINEGYNPVSFSGGISGNEKTEILGMLNVLGETFEVPEEKLEAYAIISAMAPTYFWFQWKKLINIAVEIGLGKEEAKKTIYSTMIAALNTMFKSDLNQDEVFNLIPVKPIGENEKEIENMFDQKLKGLYSKLTS